MKKLTLAYFGTPDFSARLLEKLIIDKLVDIKFVLTQPDKPVGRKQILTPSPVKLMAEKYKIKTITSLKIDSVDLVLLYAYGKIIPEEILNLPKFGFWNIHPSLLPKYRGPSPIAFPLINGDKKTGMTLMQMDKELDHGPIIDQQEINIENGDKRPDLENKLTDLGYELFKKNLLKLTTDNLPSTPQNHSLATFTHLLKKNDGYLDWKSLTQPEDPEKIYQLFRGLFPWPGIWTKININHQEKRLKILDLRLQDHQLTITQVQLEGKKPVDFATFKKAYLPA